MVKLEAAALEQLFRLLQKAGYTVAGPTVRSNAIVLEELSSFDQVPVGYEDEQAAGSYRIKKTSHSSYFRYAVGPHSVKKFLQPPKRKLWSAKGSKSSFEIEENAPKSEKIALFGLRSCDVKAIEVLDRVFMNDAFVDQYYKSVREELFLVTADCPRPSDVCFCTSMGHGPKVTNGFDINLTELDGAVFLGSAGSMRGQEILDRLENETCTPDDEKSAAQVFQDACKKIEKQMPSGDIPALIKSKMNDPHWDKIAERCLSCANCTMSCPTCFCSTTEDVTDLTGDNTERWLRWDSCFTSDISYIHGGATRPSVKSRYRQWLSHKLSSWHEQFDMSGCVGCGRCIAWCPVGIDLTEEVQSLKETK